jgi:hypothetical protein
MRYIVLLRAPQMSTPPPPELMAAIMQLGDEATQAGQLLDTAGLAPSVAGARIQLAGGQISVTDGPFAEAKETISYAIYQVHSKEEAVEWSARFLRLHRDLWPGYEGECDVLKVMGPEDFA